MNSVERVLQYSRKDLIVQEAPYEVSERKPPVEWPSEGSIDFDSIRMNYRPGLPEVLKGTFRITPSVQGIHNLFSGISMHVRGGEKIGIVGR